MNQSLSHSIDRLSDRSFDTRIGVIWIKQLISLSSKPLGASRARPKGTNQASSFFPFYNFWPTTQASPNKPALKDRSAGSLLRAFFTHQPSLTGLARVLNHKRRGRRHEGSELRWYVRHSFSLSQPAHTWLRCDGNKSVGKVGNPPRVKWPMH